METFNFQRFLINFQHGRTAKREQNWRYIQIRTTQKEDALESCILGS